MSKQDASRRSPRTVTPFPGYFASFAGSERVRNVMKNLKWFLIIGTMFVSRAATPVASSTVIASPLATQYASASNPSVMVPGSQYARIAILRPNDGDTIDFEAGYIRHLAWHRQAKDTWVWYGWSIWAGERQRWFVYASFGHSPAELDNPVLPADDERDNVANVAPHCQYLGNAIYEYLPLLSRGTGVPQPTARLEFTTVDLVPGSEKDF
jgi:hypothetical protein